MYIYWLKIDQSASKIQNCFIYLCSNFLQGLRLDKYNVEKHVLYRSKDCELEIKLVIFDAN